MYIEQRIKPKRESGFRAWFKRWFLCGIIEERRTMKIYMEIIQVEPI